MILLAQIADPLRVILVALAMWLVPKLYDPGVRLVPTIVSLVGVAVAVSLVLASIHTTSRTGIEWLVFTALGFLANLVLWFFFTGLVTVYRWQNER